MKSKVTPEATGSNSCLRVIAERPRRVFAVGDIHGYHSEVSVMLDHLVAKEGITSEDLFIFIGDYIDRGPGSRQVIDRMLEVRKEWPQTVFLKGNHEDMLLSYLGLGGDTGQFYLQNGGGAFFNSYGFAPSGRPSDITSRLPVAHLEFLRGLELGVTLAEFIFVHAGIRPDRPLEQQDPADLLWIRKEFLESPHNTGKTVVFGHTAFNDIHLQLPYRIGIDTGVAFGNKFSVVELVNGDLYQLEVGAKSVRQRSLKDLLPHTP